jgi:hypothetical protein
MTLIVIGPRSDAEAALWRTTTEVAGLLRDLPWVIVGGQMIMLLEFERGRPSGRATRDLDAVVDVRAVADVTRRAAQRLREAGFAPSAEHPHRFVRGREAMDLLAPDHLGRRADLTTIAPHVTTGVAGGSRALETRRPVEVEIAGIGRAELEVPSLAGAIAMKAAAYEARREGRDLEDLVRLLALVEDVEALRGELKPAERRRLGSISGLQDAARRAWSVAVDPDDARAAFARLADE